MSLTQTRFERAAAPRLSWSHHARRALIWLGAALDRLTPPPDDASPDPDLPPEWFKYPPI